MDMTGEYTIKAPREQVWAALNDPEALKQAISGCEELTRDGDGFTATVVAKVGPVKAKFGGRVTLSELDPPNGYTISGEGQGGAAGFARGGAKVRLEDDGAGGTVLRYTASAQIGGKLAQIGSRLIDGAAKKMADDFFSAFSANVESRAGVAPDTGAATSEETAPAPATAPIAAPAGPPAKGLHPAIWIAGLVVVLGAILYFFTQR
ncbi:MAG: carbon monoxide dehydrogenase subunit G [Rhodospirillaceae bacterium]|nr:carbon monoxide dehydrogenase subunit G [Rhodospirillaceae bacterium]